MHVDLSCRQEMNTEMMYLDMRCQFTCLFEMSSILEFAIYFMTIPWLSDIMREILFLIDKCIIINRCHQWRTMLNT